MMEEPRELAESLNFQISLLRLAVVPHDSPRYTMPGATAEQELAELSRKVPAASRPSSNT